jgi:hypothetical protein
MSDPSSQGTPPQHRDDPPGARGWPRTATLIGAVVMLLLLTAPQEAAVPKNNLADMIGTLLGYAIFALVVWGALYAITIRRASRHWKIGSLVVLMAIGMVDGFISISRAPIAGEIETLPGPPAAPVDAPKA